MKKYIAIAVGFLVGILIGVWITLGVEVVSASGDVAPVEVVEVFEPVEVKPEVIYCTAYCETKTEEVMYCNRQVGEGCGLVRVN